MTDRHALLVTPASLAQELAGELADGFAEAGSEHTGAREPGAGPDAVPGASTLVLDVRWSLAVPDGAALFAEGHVPGAVYVDLESELSGHGPATAGRHPLPGDEVLTNAARRWGLRPGDRVVAYDGGGNLAAARAWWLLRDAGIDVRLLDGAWPAWVAARLPVETGASQMSTKHREITLVGGRMPRLTLEEVAAWVRDAKPNDAVLLDARAAERYSGDTEPIDPRAGHVPGARSLPTTGHLDATGRFLSTPALRARFMSAGVEFDPEIAPTGEPAGSFPANSARVAAYCGSGITASHTLFALELAGHRGALFPGSWSQWSNHPELPVATGPMP